MSKAPAKIEKEDRKRLVKARTALTNSIKGLLKLHGVFDLEPRAGDFDVAFAAVTTACGAPLLPRARREIERLAERLGLVMWQGEAVEAERATNDAPLRAKAAAGSALSQWFQARTAGARGRTCRVMIVALARKLLIALWRYADTGLVPTGARVA